MHGHGRHQTESLHTLLHLILTMIQERLTITLFSSVTRKSKFQRCKVTCLGPQKQRILLGWTPRYVLCLIPKLGCEISTLCQS